MYEIYKQKSDSEFLRLIGVNKVLFDYILSEFTEYIEKHWDKRGSKSSLSIADKLIITFRNLRGHPTFLELGNEFNISESYAQKVFTKITHALIKVFHLPKLETFDDLNVEIILTDASEQPIERPKRKQKKYYSGKKKDIPSKLN